jgi:hypothetical protein
MAGPAWEASRGMLSVIVLAADIVRIVSLPPESDPVLLVHANTVVALAISSQGFEPIAGQMSRGTRRAALLFRSTHRAAIQRSFSGMGLPFCLRARRSSA